MPKPPPNSRALSVPQALAAAASLRRQGKLRDAEKLLRGVLQLDPDHVDAHNNLGNVLAASRKYVEAVSHYRKALEIKPELFEAHSNLAIALAKLGSHAEAVASFERTLALKPNLAEAHAGLGRELLTLGRIDEARRELETAVELAPRRAAFYLDLAEAKRFAAGDPQFAAMEALAADAASLPADERTRLDFALGKAYADIGAHEKAFPHFLAGNAQKRRELEYNEAGTLAMMARVKSVFTHELFRQKAGHGDASEIPVFVVGMPRSGSTLVEQMLASHPEVTGAGELEWMTDAAKALQLPGGANFPELVPTLGANELRKLASAYLDALGTRSPGVARVVDKMPANFLLAGLIHLAFPKARIVHVERNAVDTCVSCFSKLFERGVLYSYDLAELGRYYSGYRSVMAHWRDVLPAGAMIDVRYEDLVADFETEARRIVAFIGLAWDARCLAFHRTERPVLTASAMQVREPVTTNAVRRWQPYVPMIRPLLDALGRPAQ